MWAWMRQAQAGCGRRAVSRRVRTRGGAAARDARHGLLLAVGWRTDASHVVCGVVWYEWGQSVNGQSIVNEFDRSIDASAGRRARTARGLTGVINRLIDPCIDGRRLERSARLPPLVSLGLG